MITMKSILKAILALMFYLALAAALTLPTQAETAAYVGQITGGSNGKFVATSHSLTTSGYTDFSVSMGLRQDGTALGEFTCAIPNFVVLAIIPTGWSLQADGSIKVTGTEYGYDPVAGSGFTGTGTVVFRAGGPGVGGFDFADEVFPPGYYDTEIVRFGSIDITLN